MFISKLTYYVYYGFVFLFLFFFFQNNIYLLVLSLCILILLMVVNLRKTLYELNFTQIKLVFFCLCLLLSYVLNIFIHSFNSELYKELTYVAFFRYDGKLFFLPLIFILTFLSIRINIYKFINLSIVSGILSTWIFSILFMNLEKRADYFSGQFNTHNGFGGFVASLIILTLSSSIRGIFKYTFLFVEVCLLILSSSRTFFISLLLSIIFVDIFTKKKKILFNVAVIILILLILTENHTSNLIDRIVSPSQADMFNIYFRIEAQKESLTMLYSSVEQFLFGMGIGKIDDFLKDLIPFRTETEITVGKFFFSQIHPHNIYITILSEQGILGLSVFVLFHIYILYLSYKYLCERIFILVLELFLLLLISGFFGNSFFSPANAGYFYVITAIALRNNINKLSLKHKM